MNRVEKVFVTERFAFATALALGLAYATACAAPTASDSTTIVEGPWTLNETVSYDANRTICNSAGTLSIAQELKNLVGSYSRSVTCGSAGQFTGRSEAGALINGRAEEGTVKFTLGDCEYRGAVTTVPLSIISGTLLCLRLGSNTVESSGAGTWRAYRLDSP